MRDINFRSFSIKNFLSIGNDPIELNFTPGLHLITGHNKDKDGRRNGVGKSTVMDALHWVIFGKTIRDINKDTIANFNTKGMCQGTVEFTVNLNGKTNQYKIERQLQPSKCEFFVNDEDKTLSTTAKTNDLICEVLGFTSTLFINSVILSINNTTPFLAQDKTLKRKFVEGVFNLEVFGDILKDVSKKALDIKKEIDITITKIDGKKQNVNVYTAQKDMFEVQRAKNIADTQKDIEVFDGILKDLSGKVVDTTEFTNKQEAFRAKKKKIQDSIKNAQEDIQSAEKQNWEAKKRIESTTQSRQQLFTLIEQAKPLAKIAAEIVVPPSDVVKLALQTSQDRKTALLKTVQELRDKKSASEKDTWTLQSGVEKIEAEKKAYEDTTKQKCCPTCNRAFETTVILDLTRITEYENLIGTRKIEVTKSKEVTVEISEKIKHTESEIAGYDKHIIECTKELGNIEQIALKKQNADKQVQDNADKIKKSDTVESFNGLIEADQIKMAEHITKIETLKSIISKLETDGIDKIEIELEKLNGKIQENNKIKSDVDHNQKLIVTHQKRIDEYKAQVNTFIEMLETASKELKLFEDELTEQNKLHAIYESAKFIVSEQGVKTYIIKKLLSVLNDRIDYYLKKLDGNSTCVFNEFFDETIKNDKGVECSYFNFSGAEMKTIDLACLFAFMDIRRMQGDVGINISMYDELFDSSFDEKGLEHVTEILKERVSTNKESVFVISHRKDTLKAVTGEVIYLEKQNGVTRRIQNG